MKLRVLVVDDEESILKTFKLRLAKSGYDIFLASNGESGLEILSQEDCHVVITDLKMPGLSGEEIVKRVHEAHPDTKIVVITGYATVESAVEVMKAGASDFLVKPLDFAHVRIVLEKIKENLDLKEENRKLKDYVGKLKNEIGQKYGMGNLIGKSKAMLSIFDLISRVAPLDSTVMIYGETGTGKEMAAKLIHYNSPRKSYPMVTVDCGTLAETLLESELFGHEKGAFTGAVETKHGRFEQAEGGTIFLDEIGNASPAVQKRLLRVIQEKKLQRVGGKTQITVDVRIVAAANQNLSALVREGKFRRDLYYRLNVVPVNMPFLKERKEDIPLLAKHFVDRYARKMGLERLEISPGAMKELMEYSWPGNIRELLNVIERTLIMSSGKVIDKFFIVKDTEIMESIKSVPKGLDLSLKDQIADLEYNFIKLALEKYNGCIRNVVECSGLHPRTLYRKMKSYGLDKKDF